jgi:hypothetical protein
METVNGQQWSEFTENLMFLNRSIRRSKLKFDLLDDSNKFARAWNLPGVHSETMMVLFDDLDSLDNQVTALNKAFALMEEGKAGPIQSIRTAGFDIVAIDGKATAAEIHAAIVHIEKLGAAPFIIAAGIAVTALVVGAVITVTVMLTKQKEIEAAIDHAQIGLEHQLMQTPEILKQWTEYKKTTQAHSRSMIDNLLGEGAGARILAGAGGIAIILIGGYFLMKYMDRKAS